LGFEAPGAVRGGGPGIGHQYDSGAINEELRVREKRTECGLQISSRTCSERRTTQRTLRIPRHVVVTKHDDMALQRCIVPEGVPGGDSAIQARPAPREIDDPKEVSVCGVRSVEIE